MSQRGPLSAGRGGKGMAGNYLSKLSVREYNWSSQETATQRTAVCMPVTTEWTDGLIAIIQGILGKQE
jgi:hypothetical protein